VSDDGLLPDARLVGRVSGFFRRATLNADGTADLVFRVPTEMKPKLIEITAQDGLLLNLTIHETQAPDLASVLAGDGVTEEAIAALERAVGGSSGRVVLKKGQ
jgi:hypothetical protein